MTPEYPCIFIDTTTVITYFLMFIDVVAGAVQG